VATVSNPQIIHLWPDMPLEFRDHLKKVEYLNLVCVTLVLKQPLCPFYVTNITDAGFPFTGVIDATNVIPEGTLKGKGLVYLPRYMPSNDPFSTKSDNEILDIFITALRKIFTDLSDGQILAKRINRESHVQPIQKIDYSKDIPPIQTPLKNFFMVNTTMILNSTLNNNQVIQLSRKAANLVAQN
jgi:protoporphyrinogen oxidase